MLGNEEVRIVAERLRIIGEHALADTVLHLQAERHAAIIGRDLAQYHANAATDVIDSLSRENDRLQKSRLRPFAKGMLLGGGIAYAAMWWLAP